MKESITTHLSEDLLRKVDALVTQGKFANRSEAIQFLLEQQLEHIPPALLSSDIFERLETKSKLSDEELMEISKTLFGEKTVEELIAEGRGQ